MPVFAPVTSATRPLLLVAPAAPAVAAAPAPEVERAAERDDRADDRRNAPPSRRHGLLRLHLRAALHELPHAPAEHGVAPVHDSHGASLLSSAAARQGDKGSAAAAAMQRSPGECPGSGGADPGW